VDWQHLALAADLQPVSMLCIARPIAYGPFMYDAWMAGGLTTMAIIL